MLRSLLHVFVLLAALSGVVALVLALQKQPPEPELLPQAPLPDRKPRQADLLEQAGPPRGGTYAGQVLDATNDLPVAGARVILVSYDAGDREEFERYAASLARDAIPDPTLVPTIGDYEVAGELVADGEGRFEIAADRADIITHILAYQTGYFFEVLATPGMRDENGRRGDIVIRLPRAGRVVGTVVDHETGATVPNARVDIFLQNKTRPPPELPEAGGTGARSATGNPIELSQIAALGRFVAKELGERVWGIPYESGESLQVRTDANGRFEIGPFGDSVQLEFIVTHPEYKWYDFDSEGGTKQGFRRSVVTPGETLEREFRLRRGGEIQGRVIRRTTGEGVADALVEVQSISRYYDHHWYTFKYRRGRTDSNGNFRVAGLAIGSQNVAVRHPAFGTLAKHGVEPGEKKLLIYAEDFGALAGTVEGLSGRPPGGRLALHMEPLDGERAYRRLYATLDRTDRFQVPKLTPGRYRVWIRAGGDASLPQEIEIAPQEETHVTFPVDGGGAITARFVNAEGGVVDPVNVGLVRLDGETERVEGNYISREGALDAEGVTPGRYRLDLRAPGFVPARSAPFEVFEGRNTVVEVPPLEGYGYLVFSTILDERGRPYDAARRGAVTLEVGTEATGFRRFQRLTVPYPLSPGTVTVRARAERAGLSFEQEVEVRGGERTPVEVRLR